MMISLFFSSKSGMNQFSYLWGEIFDSFQNFNGWLHASDSL